VKPPPTHPTPSPIPFRGGTWELKHRLRQKRCGFLQRQLLHLSCSARQPEPFTGSYWSLIAQKGDTGQQGLKGDKGDTGTAATVTVDPSTVTGAAGSSASVTNTGTSSAAAFKFTIPRVTLASRPAAGLQLNADRHDSGSGLERDREHQRVCNVRQPLR
jgi:hypothetical protein